MNNCFDLNNKHTTVRIGLFEHCLRNNQIFELRLFLFLKLISNGVISYKELFKLQRPKCLKSKKTVNKYLNKLERLKWIGINHKEKIIHLRSYNYLNVTLNIKSKKAYEFSHKNFDNFRIFSFSLVLSNRVNNFCRHTKMKERRKKQKAFNKKSVSPNNNYIISGADQISLLDMLNNNFMPIANKTIAKFTGLSPNLCAKYKKEAHELGFIKVVHNVKKLDIRKKFHCKTLLYNSELWNEFPIFKTEKNVNNISYYYSAAFFKRKITG